jgi:inosine-uridine nucleoside N-ribohydrolase
VTRIIVDCDPGHDDAIALLLALGSPELNLLGVTTVAGNTTLEHATANAIRVLDHVGRADVPVAAGAARPLVRERAKPVGDQIASGLEGPVLPAPSRTPGELHAIDWIAQTALDGGEPPTLVAIGPLTNVALLLARYPEVESALERVVLMGGSIGEGNMTPAAEFNIWTDPEAAARVFMSGLDLTMVGLDVTYRALMMPEHAERFAAAGRAGKLVFDLYAFYSRFHPRRLSPVGVPVHDAVAVAHLIDPALLELYDCGVKVDTGGELSRGRTYVDLWGQAGWPPNCHVAADIDAERFFDLLLERIGALG